MNIKSSAAHVQPLQSPVPRQSIRLSRGIPCVYVGITYVYFLFIGIAVSGLGEEFCETQDQKKEVVLNVTGRCSMSGSLCLLRVQQQWPRNCSKLGLSGPTILPTLPLSSTSPRRAFTYTCL